MDHVTARAFVDSWVTGWNAHDLNAVLTHFADDVTFRSPVAVQLLGGDGVIRGKDALRATGLRVFGRIPDLRFECSAATPTSTAWSSTTAIRRAA